MKHLRSIIYPELNLNDYLQLFWAVNEAHKNLEEHVMPLGRMELLYVEKPYMHISESGEIRELKGWVLMGQRTKVTGIRSIDSINIFGLRFRPWGLYNLIKIPLHEFKDTVISLSEISPKLTKELDEAIEDSCSNPQRCKNLQKFLLNKLATDKPAGMPVIKYTLDVIRSADRFSVLKHAESTGISHKNLNRSFKKFTGLTIKEYHKIFRLRKTLNFLSGGIIPNWAELAASNGFFDQSHLIKEFKDYSGCTPIEYLFKRNTRFFGIL